MLLQPEISFNFITIKPYKCHRNPPDFMQLNLLEIQLILYNRFSNHEITAKCDIENTANKWNDKHTFTLRQDE